MVATSASQAIYFIASVLVAGAVVGVFYAAITNFAGGIEDNSLILASNLRADVKFVNDPEMVPYVVYDYNATFYLKNTGKSNLNWNKTSIHLMVNGSYWEVQDSALSTAGATKWIPGETAIVTVKVTGLVKDVTYSAKAEVRDTSGNGMAEASLEFKVLEKSYYFAVSGISDPLAAGTASDVVVTVYDAYGQIYTGYRGSITFSTTDTNTSGLTALPPTYQFTEADGGNHTFTNGVRLTTAGEQAVTVIDAANITCTGSQRTITVNSGALARFTLTRYPSTATAGVSTSPYTVTARDLYNNTKVITAADNGRVDLATTSASATKEFRTLTNGPAVTYVTMPVGSSSMNFYYYDATAGSYTIAATPAGAGLTGDTKPLSVYNPG